MTIECIKFRKFDKGTLKGFADIWVPKWGLELYGITLHEKEGRRWVNFPANTYEKEGETKSAPHYRFRNKDHWTLFCEKVKEAIDQKIKEDSTYEGEINESDSTFCF